MKEKIVAITGANSGIGKAAAVRFAKEGHRVVMACRNTEIGKRAQQDIIELTKNNNVDLIKLDVSSFESIQYFCKQARERYEKLDVLIHNAGYFNHGEKQYQLSPENIELTFATNTFGPFLMTDMLLYLLSKSEDPRILNACSTNIRHFFDPKRKIDFDNLQGEFKASRTYNSYKMYGDSKMALLMLTFRMAEEYKGLGIKVNAVQIPAVKLSRESVKKFKPLWRIPAALQSIHGQSPEAMGETYFHICTSEEFNNVTGQLINDKKEILRKSDYSKDLVPSIKQFLDKKVYPNYACSQDNIEKVWRFANGLIEKKLNHS